jgi:mannose-6-phosphate isomerase
MSDELRPYAKIPLKQLPNRVWRTYQGGALIDRWKKDSIENDGNLPEEWIMSTISARGKNRPTDEGLSLIRTPKDIIPLDTLISSDLDLFIGERLAKKFGTPGVLIKMLDSNERLTIQVHPDKEFARSKLNSEFGKTESWFVLDVREMKGEKSCIYLGFKEGITQEKWANLFLDQDIEGMLNSLHRFDVLPGDAFIIYGGVPHVIGSGCFLMEVQEPTDFTMRVEKTTPGGIIIGDELIHQGVGEENMLKCFHYNGCSFEEAIKRWKITPVVIDSSDSYTLRTIINETHTDCFALAELEINGEYEMRGNGSFFVGVVYSGEGNMSVEGETFSFTQGDEIFFSAAIERVTFKSEGAARILLCYPPL